jgi:hypothetical protein
MATDTAVKSMGLCVAGSSPTTLYTGLSLAYDVKVYGNDIFVVERRGSSRPGCCSITRIWRYPNGVNIGSAAAASRVQFGPVDYFGDVWSVSFDKNGNMFVPMFGNSPAPPGPTITVIHPDGSYNTLCDPVYTLNENYASGIFVANNNDVYWTLDPTGLSKVPSNCSSAPVTFGITTNSLYSNSPQNVYVTKSNEAFVTWLGSGGNTRLWKITGLGTPGVAQTLIPGSDSKVGLIGVWSSCNA